MSEMIDTILKIMDGSKGILAADESDPTIKKRFDAYGIECNEYSRHEYRHNIFSTPDIEKYIGGVILFDETIRNEETVAPIKDKVLFGIKVDKGAKSYEAHGEGEKLTEGLDGLTERLREYKDLGASFAKWRAVLPIDSSHSNVVANAYTLARYAKKCQMEGVVPIVEPEILMEGKHSVVETFVATEIALHQVFDALFYEGVELETIILKPNMILAGYDSENGTVPPMAVAEFTMMCFNRVVPVAVPIIAFLSGGQPDGEAVLNLNAMNNPDLPIFNKRYLTFSFGRELQQNSLQEWASGNSESAQKAFVDRAKECRLAVRGQL